MGYRKLGRTSSQRKALLRDLATDLIINERIETTEARAKARIFESYRRDCDVRAVVGEGYLEDC